MNIQIAIATSDPVLVERIPVLYMTMIETALAATHRGRAADRAV
jgi:hypothetical protein